MNIIEYPFQHDCTVRSVHTSETCIRLSFQTRMRVRSDCWNITRSLLGGTAWNHFTGVNEMVSGGPPPPSSQSRPASIVMILHMRFGLIGVNAKQKHEFL